MSKQDDEFKRHVREFLQELNNRAWEYEGNAKEGPENPNADFFKGKAQAYAYAAKKLKNIFDWLQIEA